VVFSFTKRGYPLTSSAARRIIAEGMMNLDICWWNTRLTPPAAKFINQSTDENLNEKFEEIITKIISERPLDLIVLCEVYKRDAPLLKKIAAENNMGYRMIAESVSGVYYDFAIIYEKTKIKINSISYIDESNSFEQQLRIGAIVDANFDNINTTLFLSHWNSEMFKGQEKKEYCAGKLRDKVNTKFKKGKLNIILMGDYNSQPYDNIITTTLETTKDLDIINKRPRVLYNPFWRNLDSRSSSHFYPGSYHYKSDAYDKWKTYDQMMFSSSFISGNPWKLDIYSPEIHNKFTGITFKFTDVFDHIPIYGRLFK